MGILAGTVLVAMPVWYVVEYVLENTTDFTGLPTAGFFVKPQTSTFNPGYENVKVEKSGFLIEGVGKSLFARGPRPAVPTPAQERAAGINHFFGRPRPR